jgi:hypothetical protein
MASGSALSSIIVFCMAQPWGIDWVAAVSGWQPSASDTMSKHQIVPDMEVIGADGVHVGTVEAIADGRIKLTKRDSGEGSHEGHNHFIDLVLVATVEGKQVRLSANAAVAVTFEEEESYKPV